MNAPVPPVAAARSQRGFSLPEMLVASAVFMLVILAAYTAFQRSQESYRLGQNQAEMVQGARVAFEQITNDIRLAGYEFDLDGDRESYDNQPDEPIEFMHRRAIVVRANFDFDKELKGREPGLEFGDQQFEFCCPIVTTANDEIVGFALGKPSGTQPAGSIVFNADISGTLSTADTDRRDGYVDSSGDIIDEETITIPDVEFLDPGATGYAPPYTLYRFHLAEDGSVVRQPFIDNVYSLEFTFFDDAGNEVIGPNVAGAQATWGGDDGTHLAAGRVSRWSVRQIKMRVQTMTPDADLRLKRVAGATSVPNFQGRRLFVMEADILPPNLGRRGSRDRDVNPPEPPRNVEICTGQCKMVRVSWDPGPPEDKVTDHIVTLCTDGPCEDDGSNFLASFIVIASFDVTEMQEYAVFTSEDNGNIANGVEIWARVVARNAAGTESECPVPDCAECCQSLSGAVVGERTRMGPIMKATGGGYDPADTAFPDAQPDNSAGMLIVTETDPIEPLSQYFPPSLTSQVLLDTPRYALNTSAAAGTAPNDWTTKNLGSGVTSASTCHKQESTPQDVTTDYRMPFNSFWETDTRQNTYVWRVSANNPASTWGGAPNARSFVPTASNLIDFRYLPLHGGTAVYSDASAYRFTETSEGLRYDGVSYNDVKASGQAQPIQAVNPCEVYYYRFRTIGLCWDDKAVGSGLGRLPPDGANDLVSFNAWGTAGDTADYRPNSKPISPFYPPMLNEGDTTGLRDRPDQSVHDSDAYGSAASVDTYAIPSYTLPQRVVDPLTGEITGWVKPAAPSEFYLTRISESGDSVISGHGDAGRPDARLIFNAARRTAPGSGEGDPQPAGFRTYRLYRKAATTATPAAAEFDFDTANPTLFLEFDTVGPDDLRHYTMQGDALVPGPATVTALRDLASDWAGGSDDLLCSNDPDDIADPSTCIPWIYWLKTAQCTKFDDGIDTSAAEVSEASRPFLFPCSLVYDVTSIDVNPATASSPPSEVDYTPLILDDGGSPDCTSIKAARLLAYRLSGGEYVGSSDWVAYADGAAPGCQTDSFNSQAVQQAMRDLTEAVRFVVEVSTATADRTANEDDDPIGCRLRSDFGPTDVAEVRGIPVACGSARTCGSQSSPAIFGTVDDATIQLTDSDTKMLVDIPILLGSCAGLTAVDLRQLEFKLEKSLASGDNDIPDFVSARIIAGLQAPRDLPDPSLPDPCDLVPLSGDTDAGEDDAGEADLDGTDGTMVLRWRDSFCEKTDDPDDDACACEWNYPTVVATAPTLTVELTFDDSLCDVRLTEFNFRVPLEDLADTDTDGVIYEELTCTQRARRAADGTATGDVDHAICPDTTPNNPPAGPAGADPDLPEGCTLEGEGRGPALSEEVACATCTETCQPCQCPLLDTDSDITQDLDPTYSLETDPGNEWGASDSILNITWTQQTNLPCDSPECDFTISEIEIEIVCGADRDCNDWGLMKYGDPDGQDPGDLAPTRLEHFGTGIIDTLPNPSIQETALPDYRRFVWTGLNVPIADGETFKLMVVFDDALWGTVISKAAIRFAQPFAAECNADGSIGAGYGPLCDAPNDHVIPMP